MKLKLAQRILEILVKDVLFERSDFPMTLSSVGAAKGKAKKNSDEQNQKQQALALRYTASAEFGELQKRAAPGGELEGDFRLPVSDSIL